MWITLPDLLAINSFAIFPGSVKWNDPALWIHLWPAHAVLVLLSKARKQYSPFSQNCWAALTQHLGRGWRQRVTPVLLPCRLFNALTADRGQRPSLPVTQTMFVLHSGRTPRIRQSTAGDRNCLNQGFQTKNHLWGNHTSVKSPTRHQLVEHVPQFGNHRPKPVPI